MWRPLTNRYCRQLRFLAFSGRDMKPLSDTMDVAVSMGMSCCSIEREKSDAMRFLNESKTFLLLDTPDEEKDRMLSEHIMKMYAADGESVDSLAPTSFPRFHFLILAQLLRFRCRMIPPFRFAFVAGRPR